MRFSRLAVFAFLFIVAALAQNDRGTITGTVTDPASASVPGAAIVARNTQTGAQYEAATTVTGNYTLAQLPAGVYEVNVTAAGFSKFIQQGITVQVAETATINVVLKVGSASESVTVTADAPLLKTDSSDVSHNISENTVNNLALYGQAGGAGGGIRNPYAFMAILPGASFTSSNNDFRVNGLPNDTYSMRIEGQEATYSQQPNSPYSEQPSVDGLQEVTLLTSNFNAEYGQAGGGIISFTAKSGTNQLHGGSIFDLQNEDFNAGQPFSNSGHGHLVRPKSRHFTYGGNAGGPVWIPHVYNGKNKTFFFFNIEESPSHSLQAGTYTTVPTAAMRNGDFSSILTGKNLATDPLGRAILENTVYDPGTQRTQNGAVVRDPFPGNIVPVSTFDPIAAKIQALIPLPQLPSNTNNYQIVNPTKSNSTILTIKMDENISSTSHLSFYLGTIYGFGLNQQSVDGMPFPITGIRNSKTNSPTGRINFDETLSPTLLFHAGIGFMRGYYMDSSPVAATAYDAPGQLGLLGGVVNDFTQHGTSGTGFPQLTGLSSSYGGAPGLGINNARYSVMEKPSVVTSIMKVLGSHTFKAGGEWRRDNQLNPNVAGASGVYNFSGVETGLPSTNGQSLSGGAVGFPYASFLLGLTDSASVTTPQYPYYRRSMIALYAQDTWKVTRSITLDYGLRWDRQTGLSEIHNELAGFMPSIPNPSAGNLLGAYAWAGSGPGTIGGQFAKTYPDAFGPRLGVAWQLAPKTVLRAGVGVIYGQTQAAGYNTLGYNQLLWTTSSYGAPATIFKNGLQYTQAQLYPTTLNPGIRPAYGQIASPNNWLDPNGGRPPRILSWSIGLQREILRDLSLEASYVGNRAVWLAGNNMNNINALTPQRIASFGLNSSSAADQALLNSRMDSPLAISRGFSTPLYPGFPLSTTVAQSLRPFPQFSTIGGSWSPLGNSWYDSVQVKLTKRTSHGLTLMSGFTFSKELQLGTEGSYNNVFNRGVQRTISASSQPFALNIGADYEMPKLGPARWTRVATGGWFMGTVLRYASGFPIAVPTANNSLSSLFFQSTFVNRVPGVPLFTQDLNCHCFDPSKTFALNPAAWTQPAAGQWGTAAEYYNDYRGQRQPNEQANFGRRFQIREGMRLEFRAVFSNVFNRTRMNAPTASNSQATQTYNGAGITSSGFGYINTSSAGAPRQGMLQLRLMF